jgi:hypothetical protein|tara:strand:- start:458 stop:646 length:189 start_codon:yes stop_codon:yes gene_type:complete
MRIPPIEQKRIQNINFIMDDLHTSINNIYELLMDKDYDLLRNEVIELNKKLKSISESLQDEI